MSCRRVVLRIIIIVFVDRVVIRVRIWIRSRRRRRSHLVDSGRSLLVYSNSPLGTTILEEDIPTEQQRDHNTDDPQHEP